MRVLVVGGGGREHALCWKIRQSRLCSALYCAPGNAGIAAVAELVPIAAEAIDKIVEWTVGNAIDLIVVGPDDPLAAGLVDALAAHGRRAFGPTRLAAELESSKSWAKRFCRANDIPTARFEVFDRADDAHGYVDREPPGLAVKADGLARGKGVYVCPTRDEAHAAIEALMCQAVVGGAGARVVIEELLRGREVSASAICDGSTYRMLPFARDHKRALDGDRGPNTGGMGAISPPTWATDALMREVEMRVVGPAMRGMRQAGRRFVGFLYPGLMVTEDGVKVIEFNARLGDPEAQVLLPRLEHDLLELLDLAVDGRLAEAPAPLPISDDAACCVVLASGGYPGAVRTGEPIDGLDRLDPGTLAFHAGTTRLDGRLVTSGGRVLGITAVGSTLAEARAHAYANVDRIRFAGMHARRDIGALA